MKEKRYRSIVKTISWRITGTIDTFLVSYLITGKVGIAASISGVEVFTKLLLYYLHERVWNRIKLGREKMADPEYQI
ncbi:DUF2061 domain-containing protein [Carboxylicivirga caseinilyticus]|uniref:DUF2061 domain-containing protein n=1 Tax=Carboxylicivirga caseinilyticus TaxID=3417572 RepID=UPI003D331AF6|nr:DUF2061 domain-containing protein [Marinilabiliaceae bacterium A049]